MRQSFKELVKEIFGDEELTAAKLWALVKLLKFVRLRCRNNAALNNQLNAAFPYATFRQVPKTRPGRYGGPEEKYMGLAIVVKSETAGADEADD